MSVTENADAQMLATGSWQVDQRLQAGPRGGERYPRAIALPLGLQCIWFARVSAATRAANSRPATATTNRKGASE
jgi:hypothetical protein